MDYLKEIVRVDVGVPSGISVGTVKDYIFLKESETAKILYNRLNLNRSPGNWLSISECKEHARKIRSDMCQIKLRMNANV